MIFPCEEDDPVRPHFEESGEEFRDIELECEEEEAREPCVLRDPGAPTEAEVERHNVTHMPFRSWCPACVEGKARDKYHQKAEGQVGKEVPEIVFDYCFLGSEGEDTVAIQVTRDRRTRMIFAHVVPKKGFSHEHGTMELIKDIAKLGYNEIILKCDGEPALKTIQEEVRRQRSEKTILENSPVGDSRANGAAERAVQAIAEQVRVIRRGLEQRLELRLSGKHPVTAWLVERAAAPLPCKCACELVFLSQTFTRVRNEVLLSRLPAILSIVPFRVSQLLARHCHGDGALPYMANSSS